MKAYLATHNCYGVDLNPIAVELAKVSLWLNTIYPGSRCPWFGLRLAVGNSLIGARRQVFKAADLKRKKSKDNPNWLGLVPEHVPLGPTWQDRPKNTRLSLPRSRRGHGGVRLRQGHQGAGPGQR